ncbi:MAG: hypothetical protein ABI396_19215 [Ktedonobacteraceae bacterium]
MQGYPFDLLLTEYPPLAPLVTDTSRPQQRIPVYYFHSVQQPYCSNPTCQCHWMQQEVRRLLGHIIDGIYTLREAADLINDTGNEGKV